MRAAWQTIFYNMQPSNTGYKYAQLTCEWNAAGDFSKQKKLPSGSQILILTRIMFDRKIIYKWLMFIDSQDPCLITTG